jgi:hypothetical protein
VFDVEVEGSVPAAFNDLDPFALGGGAAKGAVVTASGITSDGFIDLEFIHQVENPNPKAIEIIVTTPAPAGVVASPTSLDFGTVTTGQTSPAQLVTLSNPIGSSGPVQITTLGITGAGFAIDSAPTTPLTLNPGESTTVGVEFAPTTAGPASGTLDVTHDGAGSPLSVALSGTGQDPAPTNNAPTCSNDSANATSGVALNDSVTCTDIDVGDTLTYMVVDDVDNGTLSLSATDGTFTYTSDGGFAGGDSFTFNANDGDADSNVATFTINVSLAPGTILYRINAGGPEVPAVGGGPNWAQDTDGAPSPLHNGGNIATDWGGVPSVHGSVPDTTPSAIFDTERWDPPEDNEMAWDFPVPNGTMVEMRLYFRDGWDGTTNAGDRVIDVQIDGVLRDDNFDIIAEFADNQGVMVPFAVTSDGIIDLDFAHVTQNPLVNGIEIVVAGAPAAADVVYRINTGGPHIVLPAGPGWLEDASTPYLVAGGEGLSSTGATVSPHGSVPGDTPMELFQTERWDPDGGSEMTWAFPVVSGAEYEVRFYVAEIYDQITAAGQRVFDIQVEGTTAVDDLDQFDDYGLNVGAVVSYEVAMTDSSLDITFIHGIENPAIKGIEIIKLP